jgi:peptidoglycan/LPS O-acetylase OafA/YrhL
MRAGRVAGRRVAVTSPPPVNTSLASPVPTDSDAASASAQPDSPVRRPGEDGGPAEPRARWSYRTDIQGLRAVAVLLVVLYHAHVPTIDGGYVGVDVFFVLSGFLITDLLIRERERTGSASLARFYARRVRRILPIATIVLIATVVASEVLLGFIRTGVIATDAEWASGFAANFHFAAQGTNYLNAQLPPSPVQHFWSLAIEEQFYLVWPTIFLIVGWLSKKRRLRLHLALALAAIAAASFVWSIIETGNSPIWAYFSPFTRAWELALGALLAVSVPRLTSAPRLAGVLLSWLGIAGILASAFWFNSATSFPGWAAALPVLATCSVLAGGSIAPRAGADVLLRRRPLQFIGDLSYSLYLWHWPVLVIFAEYEGRTPSVATNLILVLVSLGLSYAGYRLVENPVRYARHLSVDPIAALAVGACLITMTIGFSQVVHGVETAASASASGTPPPPATTTSQVAALVARSSADKSLPPHLVPSLENLPNDLPSQPAGCNTQAPTQHPKDCVFGDAAATRTVVMFGDSHAKMWMPGLNVAARGAKWKAILVARSGCPAPTVHELDAQSGQPDVSCDAWRSWAIAHIRTLHPQLLVLSSMYFYPEDFNHRVISSATWDHGLESTLRQLAMPGTRVIVLGDIPYLSQDPPDCLAANEDNVEKCGSPRQSAVLVAHNDGLRTTAVAMHASYVGVDNWFCDQTFCPAIVGRIAVYRDRAHISATYATWLSRLLGQGLRLR